MWGQSKNTAICKQEKTFSQEPDHAGILISDFQPSDDLNLSTKTLISDVELCQMLSEM